MNARVQLGLTAIAGLILIGFLNQIFKGAWILPQSFTFGPLTIRYYGLFLAAATLAGYVLARKRAPGYGLTGQQADDIIFYVIISGFIFARLYHVVSQWWLYQSHPLDIFKVWNGGLSIYGVYIGGFVAVAVLHKIFNFHFSIFNTFDWLAPSLILGQIIGRFGNLFNYELYGYPTNLPWKMFVPLQFRPEDFVNYNFFHPLFLYEALANALVLIFLLLVVSKQKTRGLVFLTAVLLYNVVRIFLEFLRIDSVYWGAVRINALVSTALAAVCLIGLFMLRAHGHKS